MTLPQPEVAKSLTGAAKTETVPIGRSTGRLALTSVAKPLFLTAFWATGFCVMINDILDWIGL